MTNARMCKQRNVCMAAAVFAQATLILVFQQTHGGAPLGLQLVVAAVVLPLTWVWMNHMIRERLRRDALAEFVRAYCAERGWDPERLEREQVVVIAAQPEWEAIATARRTP